MTASGIALVLLILVLVLAVLTFIFTRNPRYFTGKEVFLVAMVPSNESEAKGIAEDFGGVLASAGQIAVAQKEGAEYACMAGWASDGHTYMPRQETDAGCGSTGVNKNFVCGNDAWSTCRAGVLVYGKKAAKTLLCKPGIPIAPFNSSQWSQFS